MSGWGEELDSDEDLAFADCERLAGQGCLCVVDTDQKGPINKGFIDTNAKLSKARFNCGMYHEIHSGMTREEILFLRRVRPERLVHSERMKCTIENQPFTDELIIKDWRAGKYTLKEKKK